MDVKECYRLLELDSGAPPADLEAAYFKLLERWRPDRVAPTAGPEAIQQAERMIEKINEAFHTLKKVTPKAAEPAAASAPVSSTKAKISALAAADIAAAAPPPRPPASVPFPASASAAATVPAAAATPPPTPKAPISNLAPTPKPAEIVRSTPPPDPELATPPRKVDPWEAKLESLLPRNPKHRIAVIAGAAGLLLLLFVVFASTCSSKPVRRKAVAPPDPATVSQLVVKSNRANATIEATRTTAPGETATAAASGSADGAPEQSLANLPPGHYVLITRSAGWPELRQELTLTAGQTTEVTANFKSGSLRLDSVPTGATVKFGPTVLGKTPLAVPQLPVGECTLALHYPGWPEMTATVAVTENEETKETIRLPHGRLVVTSFPTGATVLLGKRVLGVTPLTIERFQAGSRTLMLQLKDFPSVQLPVNVEDQGEQNVRGVLANGFPLLDAPATLQAVWFELPANDPNRLSPHFDPFPGFHPQGSFVRNLNRKKLFETWLGKTYRFTGKVKSYNAANGQLEFVEQVSNLGKIRVSAQLLPVARDNKESVALLATKEATVTICGRFSAMEEFDRRGKPFEIEFTQADVVQ